MKQQLTPSDTQRHSWLPPVRLFAVTLLLLFATTAFSMSGNSSSPLPGTASVPLSDSDTTNPLNPKDMELQTLLRKYNVKIIKKERTKYFDFYQIQIDDRIYHDVNGRALYYNLHNLDVLLRHGLKLLPFDQFRRRMLELFHVDMAKVYSFGIDYSEGKFMSCFINAFGFWDFGKDLNCPIREGSPFADSSIELYRNMTQTILYNDSKSVNWVLHNSDATLDLVRDGGFLCNPKLLQSAIDSTKWTDPEQVELYLFHIDWVYPDHEIAFSDGTGYDPNDGDPEPLPSYTYRPYVVDTLLQHHVNLALLTDFLEKVESGGDKERDIYPHAQEDIDQLYRSIALAGFTGYLNDRFNDNPTLADHFAKKNYMDCPELKDFCEKFEDKHHQKEEEAYSHQQYIINDPDGYTNLRLQANVHSPVVMRIPTNSLIKIHYAAGNWLKVSYQGKDGFVYKTRIYQLLTQP